MDLKQTLKKKKNSFLHRPLRRKSLLDLYSRQAKIRDYGASSPAVIKTKEKEKENENSCNQAWTH